MRKRWLTGVVAVAWGSLALPDARAADDERRAFMATKTVFQTNTAYDPRIAIAVDGVIVHRHGVPFEDIRNAIGSWKQHGFLTGRMFFADSDATNEYWTGKWDGQPHEDEVERDANGNIVKCAGVRPYMLPTEGWIRYLEQMAIQSIDAGADAVLPEEPLAHVHTGYEEAFKRMWVERYGKPWQPERASPQARYLTAQLKNELYIKLEQRLATIVRNHARKRRRDVSFVLPVHGLYSNVASRLVAPLGTSLEIDHVDGYIGQVWTGPVNWALHHADVPDKQFFDSAYLLYDYFVSLTSGGDRKLWLLVDPVEDNPDHTWAEFEEWYRHCVTAMLMFPEVDAYEVMPWPDRIFLPNHSTGGGTPAPERFRIIVLSATQVLQEVQAGGSWIPSGDASARAETGPAIGVAVADTLMWEPEPPPSLQVTYGLMLPLVQRGVPVSACVLERAGEEAYLPRFDLIVLSYEAFKPRSAKVNRSLVKWVKDGGVLVVVGEPDDLGGAAFWWREQGHPSALHHLGDELGIESIDRDADHELGQGYVLRRTWTPRNLNDSTVIKGDYLPLLDKAMNLAGQEAGLEQPGNLCMRRGAFIVAHAGEREITLEGRFVDVFDPELPVRENMTLGPGASGVYRDVEATIAANREAGDRPCVLHCTHRLVREETKRSSLRALVRGPAGTPAVMRVFTAGRTPSEVAAQKVQGGPVDMDWRQDGDTLRLRFPNEPAGASVFLKWK